MEAPTLDWQAEALWQQLQPLLPGITVEVVREAASTNTVLLERARLHGDASACLLVAEHQSAGRGRLGRHWHSRPGASLTFTLAWPLQPPPGGSAGLSLAVGLALAEALEPLASVPGQAAGAAPRIGLKWPNDLWLLAAPDRPEPLARPATVAAGSGRKLGGILVETVAGPDGRRLALIGIGLNVAADAADAADAAADGASRYSQGRAALSELLPGCTPATLLQRVAAPLLQALQRFESAGFAPLRPAYARRDVLLGRALTTTQPDLPGGVAAGLAADGALLLRTPQGELLPLSSGEVSVRPLGSAASTVAVGRA